MMNELQQQNRCYEDDEIDLRELFLTLKRNKMIIIVGSLIVTMTAVIYVLLKNPTPIYEGSLMVEIGEIKSDNPNQIYFDNPNTLKNIIERKYCDIESETPDLNVQIPQGTSNIITIFYRSTDKKRIKTRLEQIYTDILNRYKEKAKFFQDAIMTHKIGDIVIGSKPVNQVKKELIVTVAFITGVIFSVFLVFFLEFLRGIEKEGS